MAAITATVFATVAFGVQRVVVGDGVSREEAAVEVRKPNAS